MSISARNQLPATITAIKKGTVNDLIELQLDSQETLSATVTQGSTDRLNLSCGASVVAIFKAPSVILSSDDDLVLSACNRFACTVTAIDIGAVNCEIGLQSQKGTPLVATITKTSLENLNLAVGASVSAYIKATQVVIGVKK